MKNLIIQYYIDTSLYTQPNFNKIYAEKIDESVKFKNNNFNSWCIKRFSQIEEVKKKYTYINIAKKWVEIIKKIIND